MDFTSIYDPSVFDRFLTIGSGSYREVIHFYEDHRNKIENLDARHRFEIYVCYIEALFEMGKFKEVLFLVDDAIETAIEMGYSRLFGVDIYFNLLMKKAVALNEAGRVEDSLSIIRQLLSMNPDEPNVRYFFKEIMMNRSRKLVLPTRVFFIAGVITTTILMAIEALVIMPFYSDLIDPVSGVRNVLFLFSVLIFISGEVSRFPLIEWHCLLLIRSIKKHRPTNTIKGSNTRRVIRHKK